MTSSLDFQKYAIADPLCPDVWVIKLQILRNTSCAFSPNKGAATPKNYRYEVDVQFLLVRFSIFLNLCSLPLFSSMQWGCRRLSTVRHSRRRHHAEVQSHIASILVRSPQRDIDDQKVRHVGDGRCRCCLDSACLVRFSNHC